MDKDFITVMKADGSSEKMKVVATFKLEDSAKNCIIYKSLNDQKYYAASYDASSDISKFDTNFSEKEKEQLNFIFDTLHLGGEVNA